MGTDFVYRADRQVKLEQLRAVRARTKESFEGFLDFSSEESRRAYLGPMQDLPKLEELQGVAVIDIVTTGKVSPKKDVWTQFEEVLHRGAELARLGALDIICGFEEKSSKQSKRGYDSVHLQIRRGTVFFLYSANGSRVATDPDYRREFVEAVISKVGLPLTCKEEDGHFTLSHTQGGELKILRALLGRLDPHAFSCELPGESGSSGLRKLRVFVDEFATEKRFVNQWVVHREPASAEKDPDLSKRIYELLATARLPADSYELNLEFRLEDLDGLEVARGFLGPKDSIYSRLCSFDLPDDNYGEFTVITSSAGHLLELTLRLPNGLSLVQEKTGVSLHEV